MSDEAKIPVLDPDVVTTELVKVEQAAGINNEAAMELRGQFASFYNDIVTLREQALTITDPTNSIQQKMAREVRLELKSVRCAVENARKTLKADSLARGKAIDGFANVLKYLCEPVEEQLAAVEQYAERQAAARIAALVDERKSKMQAEGADQTTLDAYNLGVMDDATFNIVLAGLVSARMQREEAARKAEADRIAREQADRIAREKAEAEAARLREEAAKREKAIQAEREAAAKKQREIEAKVKAERDAAEAKARIEKAKADAKLAAEREAREKAEREIAEAKRKEQARVDAEKAAAAAKAKAEREAAEKAERAPDKEKLRVFGETLAAIPLPEMTTAAGKTALEQVTRTLKLAISAAMNESARL